jgi:hypothetical protein
MAIGNVDLAATAQLADLDAAGMVQAVDSRPRRFEHDAKSIDRDPDGCRLRHVQDKVSKYSSLG